MKRTTKLLLICLPLLMLYSCKNTEPAATIAAPSVSVQSFPGSGKMLISWKPVETIENVDGYGVFRADSKDSEFQCLYETDKVENTAFYNYLDTDRKVGQTYFYKVKSYHLDGENRVYSDTESSIISVKAEPSIAKDPENPLMLVNKSCWLSETYVPANLVSVSEFAVKAIDAKKIVRDAYEKLYHDAEKAGFDIKIVSAYRDYALQEYLFAYWCEVDGEELALRLSAKPGRSEHQTGYALDVSCESSGWDLLESFGSTPEGIWLAENCHKYGFIIRYEKDTEDITGYAYEPWHLRYVGEKTAGEIKSQGITLEEYLGAGIR